MGEYNNRGAVFFSRKWLGHNLAQHPGAFVLYFHLLGWANHADGRLKAGEVALGERDFGERLGMSITTIRKWLRWLRDNGWIHLHPTVWGKERGTIVTVLRYAESQSFSVYKLPSEDQKMILTPGSEDEDQKLIPTLPVEDQLSILNSPESGSENDPSYTPNSVRDSGDAPSQTCPTGQDQPPPHPPEGGETKGVGLSADEIRRKRIDVTNALLSKKITKAEWDAEIERLDALEGKRSLIVRGKKRAVKGDLHV